jgi:hypothetical protein
LSLAPPSSLDAFDEADLDVYMTEKDEELDWDSAGSGCNG